jgi:hypothetical protein
LWSAVVVDAMLMVELVLRLGVQGKPMTGKPIQE